MNITEFLEARIAEDEAVARDASQGRWEVIPRGDQPTVQEAGIDAWLAITSSDPGRPKDANAKHIARHDPARVLAECKAKRVIIEQHKDWPVLVERKPEFTEAGNDLHSMTYRVTQEMVWLTEQEYVKKFGVEAPTTNMIRALAAVYADHPDYQQEWAL